MRVLNPFSPKYSTENLFVIEYYGAEMVESSVKTISRRVINRLLVDVNQLDEFACKQLCRQGM